MIASSVLASFDLRICSFHLSQLHFYLVTLHASASLLDTHIRNLGCFFYLCLTLSLNVHSEATSIFGGLDLLHSSRRNLCLSNPSDMALDLTGS